jgi:hypothetical protein
MAPVVGFGHTAISDEKPEVALNIPVGILLNVGNPRGVTISFTQFARGNWVLHLGGRNDL